MTFEELKEKGVPGETVLVDRDNSEAVLVGFSIHRESVAVLELERNLWYVHSDRLKDWKIKEPEREKVEMFWYLLDSQLTAISGVGLYYSKDNEKWMNCEHELIKYPNMPSFFVYKDNGEVVDEQ